ncbi:hypothetical protein [Lysobacter gummosus]|uniref:hypothetical protein n=1 Tax=Lysobacter gummosus TaxID=262324 RepID=UPI0036365713
MQRCAHAPEHARLVRPEVPALHQAPGGRCVRRSASCRRRPSTTGDIPHPRVTGGSMGVEVSRFSRHQADAQRSSNRSLFARPPS